MKRRTFLKSTSISTLVFLSPNFIFANEDKNPFKITKIPRKFQVTNSYELEASSEITQLWVPLPKEEIYQIRFVFV